MALNALGTLDLAQDPEMIASVRACLEDGNADVRAQAAVLSGREGLGILESMAEATDPAWAVAALRRLPAEGLRLAARHLEHADPVVRAEALECMARLAPPSELEIGRLAAELEHGHPRVRRAAIRALARTSIRREL